MKRVVKALCVFFAILLLSGCTAKNSVEPYMVDRTEGWVPSVIFSSIFWAENANKDLLYSFVFDGSDLKKDEPIEIDRTMDDQWVMERSLQAAFGERYRGIGNGKISVTELKNGIIVYATRKTAVLIEKESSTLLQCIDPRIQTQFESIGVDELRRGNVEVSVDIAKLTGNELALYQRKLVPGIAGDPLNYRDNDLPLTPRTAFDVSVESIYQKYAGKAGGLGTVGGAFYIYYAGASKSYMVVNSRFVQVLDITTGQRLFLAGGHKDASSEQP